MNFNVFEHPVIFTTPQRLTTSSWIQHLPFGMFLIDILRPNTLVELGTHYGVSYCGFCQAVKELQAKTKCYAVDNWRGDEHTGAYGAEVYDDLRVYHDSRYGSFSNLLKMNFDDALPYFADGSIDLLHIDGYHTYEAVRHDFESWLPKLSDRAVVLIHDVNERERAFGVWRYWDELKSRYPSFEMLHEHGLGVLAVGANPPESMRLLLDANETESSQIREFFYLLGMRITSMMESAEHASRYLHVQNLEAVIAKRDEEIASAKTYTDSLVAALEASKDAAESREAAFQAHEVDFTAQEADFRTQEANFTAQIAELQRAVEDEVRTRAQAAAALARIEDENRQLAEEIIGLQTRLQQQHHGDDPALQAHIAALELKLANKEETAQSAVTYARSLEQARTEKEDELRALQQLYSQALGELAFIKNSLVYRMVARPVWKLRRMVLPDASRRARFYFRLRSRARSLTRPGAAPAIKPATAPIESAPAQKVSSVRLPPLEMPAGSTVICTIISKNYLASARTLMLSLRRFHPEVQLVVLLVDEIDDYFDPQQEIFSTILAADLGILHWKHFSMKYEIMELNTAVKPYLLEILMERYQAQKVIYFDPDIVVYHNLNHLLELLDQYTVVLTPHILAPISDSLRPTEVDFLQVGTFNLGFFAISRQGQWHELLGWWQERLYAQCTREVERGLFVDQHWMDLLPSLFDGTYILRNPGYNVAYWNIQSRDLKRDTEGNYTVNGEPLIFFHFSGLSVTNPEAVSIHQNRFLLSQLNQAYQACFMAYRASLLENGYAETKPFPYAYGQFADGVPITDILRVCLRNDDPLGETWENPYDIDSADNFRNWATHPRAIASLNYLSPYALTYYRMRTDLYRAFPDPTGADEQRYAEWFVQQADTSEVFHPFYVEPIRSALRGDASLTTPPSRPVKKKGLSEQFRQAFQYYRDYPVRVKPFLPPEALTHPPENYTGPHNAYGSARHLLKQIGILQGARRLIGLRLILTARYFFSAPEQQNPAAEISMKRAELPFPPPAPADSAQNHVTLHKPNFDLPLTPGVNVIGYLHAETGVAEAARKVLRSLLAVEFPAAAYSIEVHDTSRKQDSTIEAFVQGLPHKINLFHINADMTTETYKFLGLSAYRNRYNIGYWFWETSRFPQRWRSHAEIYDEIWVGSRFVQQAIAQSVDRPVIHMPGSIEVELPEISNRARLGLPDDAFLVLFIFDALSIIERKNPWGTIRAFERAFSRAEREHSVRLVMKVTNLERFPVAQKRLHDEMRRINGILLDGYLSRLEVNSLIDQCDVYVSLHRSEGFGLTLAEAMYLGKPCIATAYSGNMDFMTQQNSSLVPYQLVELDRAYPPYDLGNVWAEPDEEAAAQYLRAAYTDRAAAKEKALRAYHDIRSQYKPETAGERIAERLQTVLEETSELAL